MLDDTPRLQTATVSFRVRDQQLLLAVTTLLQPQQCDFSFYGLKALLYGP
jgi:hypothetical protein